MSDLLILLIIGVIDILAGGVFIGAAIKCYKKAEYGGFGVNLIIAIWFVAFLIKRIFLYEA